MKILENLFVHVRMTELLIDECLCLMNDDDTSLIHESDSIVKRLSIGTRMASFAVISHFYA